MLLGRKLFTSGFRASERFRGACLSIQLHRACSNRAVCASVANQTPWSASASAMGTKLAPRANAVLQFWLGDDYASTPQNAGPGEKAAIWFRGGDEVDKVCTAEFSSDLRAAATGELDSWTGGYEGLAAVILMDQLSRNIHRGTPQMYALDDKAMQLAKDIYAGGSTSSLPVVHRIWLVMPLMHSEKVSDLQVCVRQFEELQAEAGRLDDAEELRKMLSFGKEYAIKHQDILEAWGRYPHRNDILGRRSTPEEAAGLESGAIMKF